jgi:hypothetical protein
MNMKKKFMNLYCLTSHGKDVCSGFAYYALSFLLKLRTFVLHVELIRHSEDNPNQKQERGLIH